MLRKIKNCELILKTNRSTNYVLIIGEVISEHFSRRIVFKIPLNTIIFHTDLIEIMHLKSQVIESKLTHEDAHILMLHLHAILLQLKSEILKIGKLIHLKYADAFVLISKDKLKVNQTFLNLYVNSGNIGRAIGVQGSMLKSLINRINLDTSTSFLNIGLKESNKLVKYKVTNSI